MGDPLYHPRRPRSGRAPARRPDVTIGTDARTWWRLRQGEISGIEAFSQRLLYARGELDLALGFEGLFRLPDGRPPLLRVHDVPVGRLKVSTLTMGEGPETSSPPRARRHQGVALRHRRGPRPRGYRVHAIDLPGLRQLQQAADRAVRRAVLRPPWSGRWTRWRSTRPRRRQLDGRPGRARARPPAPRPRRRPRVAVSRRRVRAPRGRSRS